LKFNIFSKKFIAISEALGMRLLNFCPFDDGNLKFNLDARTLPSGQSLFVGLPLGIIIF